MELDFSILHGKSWYNPKWNPKISNILYTMGVSHLIFEKISDGIFFKFSFKYTSKSSRPVRMRCELPPLNFFQIQAYFADFLLKIRLHAFVGIIWNFHTTVEKRQSTINVFISRSSTCILRQFWVQKLRNWARNSEATEKNISLTIENQKFRGGGGQK